MVTGFTGFTGFTGLLLSLSAFASGPAAGRVEAPRTGHFHVVHELEVQVPPGARELRLWMVLPQDDPHSLIEGLVVESPVPWRYASDSEGNRLLHVDARGPLPPTVRIVQRFELARSEQRASVDPAATRPLSEAELEQHSALLQPNRYVVIDGEIRRLAREIVGAETNPIRASRAIYDWTLENVVYWVKDPKNKKASPVGSSEYCLTSRTGNCTDFHSLYAAISRAAGIPTRILYGAFLKKELDGMDADQSYHCWIEFFAPNVGWVPLDVAVAEIFHGSFPLDESNERLVRLTTAAGYSGPDPGMVDYYFGNLEERRVLWSVGRDLALDPPAAAGRIHALPKAHVEVDGAALAEGTGWKRKLTYRQRD